MRHHALVLAALATGAPALAQTPVVIVDRSTNVSGVGLVRGISKFAVNDLGEWVMLVDTNNPDQNRDGAVIRNGFLTLQEGAPLASPPGATVDEINSLTIDDDGNIAWDLTTKTGPGNFNETGLYFNTRKVAHFGDPVPLAGLGPTATWLSFTKTVALNDHHQILVSCEVMSPVFPNIAGNVLDTLALLEIDSQGNIIAGTDIAHEGGPVPSLSSTVQANSTSQVVLPQSQAQLAINDRGQVMWQVKLQTNPDRAIYVDAELVALEGEASPVPNQTWTSLVNVSLDLNDRGDYVHNGSITGAQSRDDIIAKNGELFIQEFDAFPALGGRRVGFPGTSTPIQITNGGEVLWYVDATGNTADKGVLIGKEWVVRGDVTVAKNLLVSVFPESQTLFASSPGGRYVIVECNLEDGENVALLVDLGRVTPLEDCGGTSAELFRSSGFAVTGQTVELAMDEGQGVGVSPFLLVSLDTVPTWPPCGLQTGLGEIVIGFGGGDPVQAVVGAPWSGTQPTILDLPIPNNSTLIDLKLYAQGLFVDVGNQIPGPPEVVTTNAVEIEIGAP